MRKVHWEHRDNSWGMQHDCEMLDNGHITLFAYGIHTPENPSHGRSITVLTQLPIPPAPPLPRLGKTDSAYKPPE